MDSLLVLLATGLVAHKYVGLRKATEDKVQEDVQEDVQSQDVQDELNVQDDDVQGDAAREAVGNARDQGQLTGSYALNGRPGSMSVPGIAETVLQKSTNGDSTQKFQEQFFPQDTRATGFSVTQKPWMRAVDDANKPPRTEQEATFPTKEDRQDIYNTDLPSKVRNFKNLQTQRTIPRSREKQFESPVEGIATQNEGGGGLRGQRQLQRYHKFILNEQPSMEIEHGPKGNFTGANKSSSKSQLDNTKQELVISHTGVPVAASFKVGIPDASFELEGSNAEAWLIDQHRSGSRAPVEKSTKILPSFKVAHDDEIESFQISKNSNLSRASRPKKSASSGDTKFRDAAVETPTFAGAGGGSRLQPIDTTSEVRSKAKNEELSVDASKVEMKAASKSSGPGALVMKTEHTHTDEKLAEKDTGSRVRGVTHRTKGNVKVLSDTLRLNDSKPSINQREFTSKNHVAPQNKNLPKHLRVAPTSSITATTDMTLKDNSVDTQVQHSMKRGQTVSQSSVTPSLGVSTAEQRRVNLALFTDRMASGEALKLLSNPYSRPGSNRLQIDV